MNAATQPRDAHAKFVTVAQDDDYLADALSRFMDKVEFLPSGCWLFKSPLNRCGYGIFKLPDRNVYAHRWLYQITVGPVANTLDHLCRVKNCVNTDHLDDVPIRVNILRAKSLLRLKTHCVRGHEFNEANTYRRSDGGRNCRACAAENAAKKVPS